MKQIDVTFDSYAKYYEDSSVTKPKFFQNRPEEVFVVSKIKDTVPWTYMISDLNGGNIAGSFYEKELQKPNQNKYSIEKSN